MKHKLLTKYNKILSYLLSILGIGGVCYGCFKTEYGTPHATFKVTGKVTSENNSEIPNIQVIMKYDTSYTDNNGNYLVRTEEFPVDQEFNVQFIDVDGDTNDAFRSKDTVVSFVNPEFKDGSGSWYKGETSKDLNVQLKEKED